MRMVGCTKAPCIVVQGQSARAQFDFRATKGPHNTLRPVVTAIVNNSRVPFPVARNGCNLLLNSNCPVKKNADATFNFELAIRRSYPPVRLGVQVALVDHSGQTVFCNVLDVQVQRA